MNPRLLSVLALLTSATSLRADESRWNVTAECQMVTLPQKTALALIPALHDPTKIEGAFSRLQSMIESKDATLVANLVLKAKDGERAVTESIEQLSYATEYDPALVAPSIPSPTPSPTDKSALAKDRLVGSLPATGFEQRNIGTTLELEANVRGDGRTLSIKVVPQHVRLLRWTRYDAGRSPNGERFSVEQPQFSTAKNNCSVLLRNGQRLLLGVHKVPEPATDTLELFILKVSAVAVP